MWIVTNGYAVILTIVFILWWLTQRGSVISRAQARLLLYGILIPIAANIIYLYGFTGVEGVDWSSVTFLITGIIFLYALNSQSLLDITPIARDQLMHNMKDGMIVLDNQRRIVDANKKAHEMIRIQFLGKGLMEVEPLARSLDGRLSEGEQNVELVFDDADSQYYDALISPLLDKTLGLIGHLIIFRNITERKKAEFALEQKLLEIQKLNNELQDTQDQLIAQQRALAAVDERRRLARNMHDSVNQSIHGLALYSETLIDMLNMNQAEKAIWVAERIQESGREALKEIRLMLFETDPQQIDEVTDLVKILNERLLVVESRVGIQTEVVNKGLDLVGMHVLMKENLYWLAVEALNNALKHARPKCIKIVFQGSDLALEMEIEDDGSGFDVCKVKTGGFGMRSMRERAEIMGGTLSVESEPGNGTRVKFQTGTGGKNETNQDSDH